MVKNILRIEGLAIFVLAVYFYYAFHGNWLYFILGFIAIDASMIGYLKDKKTGALLYNLMHNWILAIISLFVGFYLINGILLGFGIILAAHIGMDRFTGFGLKYPSNFRDTHMQKV